MLWLYLITLCTLFLAIANLVQKVLMKEEQSDPYTYAIVFQFIVALIVSIGAFTKAFLFRLFGLSFPFLPSWECFMRWQTLLFSAPSN